MPDETSLCALLSIGALSRATGIPVETLRTWETRYGFPLPERKPSGHRLYHVESVARLRRISEALARGHRAGQVVPVPGEVLERLLKEGGPPATATAEAAIRVDTAGYLRSIVEFDADRLTRGLLADWAVFDPLSFLEERVAPLVRFIGEAWARGELEVRHEHFASERIGDVLRTLRLRFEERARGPLVVLATLPGEAHSLGLQMSALVFSAQNCRVLYLGAEVPVGEIATLARERGAMAVALSFSEASRSAESEDRVLALRQDLPRRVALVLGGAGAPHEIKGTECIMTLPRLQEWSAWLASSPHEIG